MFYNNVAWAIPPVVNFIFTVENSNEEEPLWFLWVMLALTD